MADEIDDGAFAPLLAELARLRASGRRGRFWLRDDDAVAPSAPLDAFLALIDRYAVPATLAVIARDTGPELADRLARVSGVSVAVHGWAHQNHAPEGAFRAELGCDRSLAVVLAEARAGREKLAGLHGARFLAVMVPPWNRIAPEVAAALPQAGYLAVSHGGRPVAGWGVAQVNTQVAPFNQRLRPVAEGVPAMVAQLCRWLGKSGDATVGINTHHQVLPGIAAAFLERLIRLTRERDLADWVGLPALLAERGAVPLNRPAGPPDRAA